MKYGHPINFLIYQILKIFCRIDDTAVSILPVHGPLIVATNHVNFLEMPVLYLYLKPRQLTGVAKMENWKNPLIRYLAHIWKAIPIRRYSVDSTAFKKAIRALEGGCFLGLAPEGTRSHDGRLGPASAGVIVIAAVSGVPVVPVVHIGGENLWRNIIKLKRTKVALRVGDQMHFTREHISTRRSRAEALDRLMHSLADLLPREKRGHYV